MLKNGPKAEPSLITPFRFPFSSQTLNESRTPGPKGLLKKTWIPPALANWTQPSIVIEARCSAGESGISTDWLTPSNEKAWPTLPVENDAPLMSAPLLLPRVSRALLSPRHQATIPAGGGALRNRAWTLLFE